MRKKALWTSCVLLLLLFLTLSACTPSGADTPPATQPPPTQTAPEEEVFVFTRENLPRLDGSTSLVPMAQAVCSVLLGESREEVDDLVQFSKTTNSFQNLIYGRADLLIVGEPNESVLAAKESAGFQWEMAPFSMDAFVFVVNTDNPVNSITVEQARAIYTGEITNWQELGGEDQKIIPFQRNAEAGSQALMEKLVMQGTPMMEPPTDYVIGAMDWLMEAVRSYDGSPGAIGYSVYYYAEEMRMAQGLKLLAIDGVEPNADTIRSGEYPLCSPNYVIIPADAPEDAPNRILYNWILGEEGQRLADHEGYVPILEVTP